MPSLILRILALALLAPLAGCPAPAEVTPEGGIPEQFPMVTGTPAERSPELDAARQRWDDAGLEGYQMTLARLCFCPSPDYTGPFEVRVAQSKVASVMLNGTGVPADRGVSVEALFELIEDAYKRGAESVSVSFDPALGYPTSIGIDYSMQMADEEIGYRVSDLRRTGG